MSTRGNFLENLKNYLSRIGMSRAELSRESGLNIHTLNTWYRDGRDPRVGDVACIAHTLGVTTDFLVFGRDLPQFSAGMNTMIEAMRELSEEEQERMGLMVQAYVDQVVAGGRRAHRTE